MSTVFIGGFAPSTNAESLAEEFQPFGAIQDCVLPPDPTHQNKHRNFAFITFSTVTAAQDAVDNMHRNTLQSQPSHTLKVNIAAKPKGITVGGSNKPIWTDEAWLAEHGTGVATILTVEE